MNVTHPRPIFAGHLDPSSPCYRLKSLILGVLFTSTEHCTIESLAVNVIVKKVKGALSIAGVSYIYFKYV